MIVPCAEADAPTEAVNSGVVSEAARGFERVEMSVIRPTLAQSTPTAGVSVDVTCVRLSVKNKVGVKPVGGVVELNQDLADRAVNEA
jgi:hypothetical protein